MRNITVVVTSIMLLLCTGCATMPNGRETDYAAARKVSDSFMADLVANNVNGAVSLMGGCPAFS